MDRTRPGSVPETDSRAGTSSSAARAVFLVGFMGAGKTSVGRVLAAKLGWEFEDLDEVIERLEGRSIEALFGQSGEAGFRVAEHAALRHLLMATSSRSCVVALGGGAFVQAENARLLAQHGLPSVFLDAPVEELFGRCQAQAIARPLRGDPEQFRKLYESRRASYLEALLRIDTGGKDLNAIAAEIATHLGLGTPPDKTGAIK